MAVSQELLDILVCPLCKVPVKLTWTCPKCGISLQPTAGNATFKCSQCGQDYAAKDGSPEPLASGQGLKCGQCRRVYPIKDDIPVMLVDEAKIEGE